MRIDSRDVMSDEELNGPPWKNGSMRKKVDEACRRFAERWGVTGRRVDGIVFTDDRDTGRQQWTLLTTVDGEHALRPAVLYIADPPPKELSAEERIGAALRKHDETLHSGAGCNSVATSCQMARILRPEPKP